MYCSKCGNQLLEEEQFCTSCGTAVEIKKEENDMNVRNNERVAVVNNINFNKKIVILFVIVVAIICAGIGLICDNIFYKDTVEESLETANRLQEITTCNHVYYLIGETQADSYTFNHYNSDDILDWYIRIVSGNQTLHIYDGNVLNMFVNYFGKNVFDEDDVHQIFFVYDFDDERVCIYFDSVQTDGIEYVEYYINMDEIIVGKSGEKYEPSEEFEKFLRENGVIDLIKEDIENNRNTVETIGLTYDEIDAISYSDLDGLECEEIDLR